ncbi:S1 family peptidase, partial [Mesorhizobium sp. M2C.T.Ca.TU.009.01.2.1]
MFQCSMGANVSLRTWLRASYSSKARLSWMCSAYLGQWLRLWSGHCTVVDSHSMHFSSRNLSRTSLAIALASGAIFFGASISSAEERFTMVEAEAGSDVQVIGATPAAAGDWPATFRFSHGGKFCTSTLVGERAILTAAHCVDNNQSGVIKIAGKSTSVQCLRNPKYQDNNHYDVALCLAAARITLPNGARYETLNSDSGSPQVGTDVTLLGFGCRSAGGGGPSGALYQGQAQLALSEFVYLRARGGAAVCFGDSGGATYFDAGGNRRIAGVASQGDLQNVTWFTNIANPAVASFFKTWSLANGSTI